MSKKKSTCDAREIKYTDSAIRAMHAAASAYQVQVNSNAVHFAKADLRAIVDMKFMEVPDIVLVDTQHVRQAVEHMNRRLK